MLTTFCIFVALMRVPSVTAQITSNQNSGVEHMWLEAASFEVLSSTIAALSKQVKAEFHLYVNLNETEASETLNSLMQRNERDVAQLVVTQDASETTFKVHGKFTSRVLTIAFVSPANMLAVHRKVNQLLWALHFRDVLFVFSVDAPVAGELHALQELFTECWRHGFVAVAALDTDGRLHRYHPFPSVRAVMLPDVAAYANEEPLWNFQGYQLRSPISSSSPRCYHYVDRAGKTANGGYFYKIVRTFLEHYNGTFQEAPMPTYELNFADVLAAFRARRIDIVANFYYMHREFAYSRVITNYNVYVIAPYAQPIPEHQYFKKPFKSTLWALIVGMVAYVVVLLSIMYWRLRRRLDFGATLLEVVKMVLFLPHYRPRMRSRVQLLTFVILLLTGFLLTNVYLAKLSSLLATTVYGAQVNSFDDIARTKFLLPQTELDISYLRRLSRIHPVVLDHIWLTSAQMVNNLRRDLNVSYLHSGIEDKINFFLYQQKFLKVPFFRRIDEILFSVPIFIPVPHGSPFLKLLNRFLLRISESGILNKIIAENEEDGILSGEIRFFTSHTKHQPGLTLQHFVLPFVLWAMGLLVACCVFVYESFLSEKRIYRKKKGK